MQKVLSLMMLSYLQFIDCLNIYKLWFSRKTEFIIAMYEIKVIHELLNCLNLVGYFKAFSQGPSIKERRPHKIAKN